MMSLSILIVGILIGLMLYPMVEAFEKERSLTGATKMNMKGDD